MMTYKWSKVDQGDLVFVVRSGFVVCTRKRTVFTSLYAWVTICATLVNSQTDRQTHRQTYTFGQLI